MRKQQTLRADAVVAKLSDREVLKNYCTFAGMHRAIVAEVLLRSLDQEPNRRRSIGLEIFANYAATLEDIALWFFVLKEWKKREGRLFDLLDSIEVRERQGAKYSTQQALNELISWTTDDMRREFGLPSDEQLLSWGWTKDMLNEHVQGLTGALKKMKLALEFRTRDQGVLVSSYNKIKHAALAIAASEDSSIGVSVMLPSRRGPNDPVIGRRKVNVGWIPCEDEELRKLVRSTILICEALWAILNLLYKSRFDNAWVLPRWSVSLPEA